MKKIIALLLAVFVLAVALAGCGEDTTAGETDPTENHVVAVDDSQLTGAASSYARKYAMGGLF